MTNDELEAIRARASEIVIAGRETHERDKAVMFQAAADRRNLIAAYDALKTNALRELADAQTAYVARGMELRDAQARLAEAEARHQRVMAVIRPFCAKYAPDLLAEFDAAAGSADVMHDNNTNVIVQANLASTLTSHPSLSPTHCCVDCGALWRQCDDFSMNLRSPSCCDNCNNAPVGPQIRPIYVAPSSADVERRPCTCPDGERPIPCPRKFSVSECQTAAGWTDSASVEGEK